MEQELFEAIKKAVAEVVQPLQREIDALKAQAKQPQKPTENTDANDDFVDGAWDRAAKKLGLI